MKIPSLIHLAGITALTICASASAAPAADRAGLLADSRGMTLYTFTKDSADFSNCYDACAKNWPPFLAKPGAIEQGDFTLVTRKDGTTQWAFQHKPLYYYAADAAPGDAEGDRKGEVWFAVRNSSSTKVAPRDTNVSQY